MAVSIANQNLLKILMDCVDFAAVKHRNQRRKNADQIPYINHPIGVAKILTDAGITDVDVIQAALLHDTVEDTDTTFEELEHKFGKRIKDIVAEVSDDKTLSKQVRKQLQIENAPSKSHEAKLVALADKIYNLTDMLSGRPTDWSEERVQEYFVWADKVCRGYRGTNEVMERELARILMTRGVEYGKDES